MTRLPAAAAVAALVSLFSVPPTTRGQQPFVRGNDVSFSIRADRALYRIGDTMLIHYTIKNVSNGALHIPAKQWDIRCGDPPHLWSALEDSSGKHYVPGYGSSCAGPNPIDQMSVSERMRKDALSLRPGQAVTGSFTFDTKIFAETLKPGHYRLEGTLYGWNVRFEDPQLSELARMGAPFLIGEVTASSLIQLRAGR